MLFKIKAGNETRSVAQPFMACVSMNGGDMPAERYKWLGYIQREYSQI
jgi:hypothetical protein